MFETFSIPYTAFAFTSIDNEMAADIVDEIFNLIVYWAEAKRIPMKRPCTEAEAYGVTNGYKKLLILQLTF